MPKVSIGLPVYNGERFLARAIDSHLAQTFTDFELVITDNCSTDATEQIGREYAEKDPRVRYLRNEENLGAVGNFQRAFEETSGPYFRWAAHDDFLEPEYLERTVGVLDREPAAAMVFTGMTIMDENEYVRRATTQNLGRGAVHKSTFRRFHCILWALSDSTSPVFGLARREFLLKTGLVRNSPEPDRILVAELSIHGGIHEDPDHLFNRTIVQGQYSRDNWAWLNPKNRGTSKKSWLRVSQHHANAISAADMPGWQKVLLRIDMVAAFVVRRTWFKVRSAYRRRIRAPKHVREYRKVHSQSD